VFLFFDTSVSFDKQIGVLPPARVKFELYQSRTIPAVDIGGSLQLSAGTGPPPTLVYTETYPRNRGSYTTWRGWFAATQKFARHKHAKRSHTTLLAIRVLHFSCPACVHYSGVFRFRPTTAVFPRELAKLKNGGDSVVN
jgi:hypothetical protein